MDRESYRMLSLWLVTTAFGFNFCSYNYCSGFCKTNRIHRHSDPLSAYSTEFLCLVIKNLNLIILITCGKTVILVAPLSSENFRINFLRNQESPFQQWMKLTKFTNFYGKEILRFQTGTKFERILFVSC